MRQAEEDSGPDWGFEGEDDFWEDGTEPVLDWEGNEFGFLDAFASTRTEGVSGLCLQ